MLGWSFFPCPSHQARNSVGSSSGSRLGALRRPLCIGYQLHSAEVSGGLPAMATSSAPTATYGCCLTISSHTPLSVG